MTLSTTPRPAYTGPRTNWTTADGTYTVCLTIPAFRLRDQGKPGCQVAIEQVAQALGVKLDQKGGSGIGSQPGYVGQPGTGYTAIFVTFDVQADSDHDAMAQVVPVAFGVGAAGTRISYMQPTEFGGSAGPETRIVDVPAQTRIENLAAELRTVTP